MALNEGLSLFLVAPEGFEEMTSVIIATDKADARTKMKSRKAIKELTDMGVRLRVVDVSIGLAAQGYNLEITKTGMFH